MCSSDRAASEKLGGSSVFQSCVFPSFRRFSFLKTFGAEHCRRTSYFLFWDISLNSLTAVLPTFFF